MGLSQNFNRAIAWIKNLIYSNQNVLRAFSICAAVFLFLVLGLINIKFLILPVALGLIIYAFYNPEKLIYLAFFIMFINGYLRWQTGRPQLIALFLDLIVATLYLKFVFDLVMLRKLNLLRQIPLAGLLLLFVFYGFVEIFNPNVTIAQGIMGFRFMIFYMPLYFIGYYYFDTPEKIKFFLKYIFVLLCLISIYGLKQYLVGFTPAENIWGSVVFKGVAHNNNVFSLQPSAQDLATLLSLYIPIFFPLAFLFQQRVSRYLFIISILFIFIVSTFTFMRGPILACFITLLFQLAFLWKNNFINHRHILRWITLGIVVTITILIGLNTLSFGNKNISDLVTRLQSIGSLSSLTGLTQQSTRMRNELFSFYERIGVWRESMEKYGGRFFGTGMGYLRDPAGERPRILGRDIIDNGLLKMYFELGIGGFALYLCIVLGLLGKTLHSKPKNKEELLFRFSILGLIISFILLNISSEYYELTSSKLSIWFFLGLYFGVIQSAKNNEN